MHGLEPVSLDCPYCGERIDVLVDCSVERQEYVEDCSVCCRPITIAVNALDGEVVDLAVRTDAD